ncbi:MAG: homoserine kinase [Frankiales bacterium]|nr:homoserine kinase [Frankiales bacterium]
MPAFRAAPVRVRVPATSANLGPGFDSLGLALGLYDDLAVRITDDGISVDVHGEGADGASPVPRNAKHLVVRAMQATFNVLGGQPRGIELNCANRIPHGRGLGSSAAAICAGITAARALTLAGEQTIDDEAAFALANQLEGHPDNVAACLFGGLTIAWTAAGGVRAARLEPSRDIVPVVFVPPGQLATAKARKLLPETVPHADAAANAGRAALLVEAMTRRPELLLDATEDRLHQSYRAPAMKRSAGLIDKLRAAGIAATISGAGPSVLALTVDGQAAAARAMVPAGWVVLTPGMSGRGAHVVALPEA